MRCIALDGVTEVRVQSKDGAGETLVLIDAFESTKNKSTSEKNQSDITMGDMRSWKACENKTEKVLKEESGTSRTMTSCAVPWMSAQAPNDSPVGPCGGV